MVEQRDGKIVVAGHSLSDFSLARYNGDDSLDPTFGSGGKVTTDFGAVEQAMALAIQSDGRLIAAGERSTEGDEIRDIVLARYNWNGTLDVSFGVAGKVTTDLGSNDVARALVIQGDGRIVVAGNSGTPSSSRFALVRYNTNGTLDGGFGSGGTVFTTFTGADRANALVVQSDGRLVAAGQSSLSTDDDFALARYNRDGTLDTRFGSGGKVTTDFAGESDAAHALNAAPPLAALRDPRQTTTRPRDVKRSSTDPGGSPATLAHQPSVR
jgi:uncharacterized delta-60 repeat protein